MLVYVAINTAGGSTEQQQQATAGADHDTLHAMAATARLISFQRFVFVKKRFMSATGVQLSVFRRSFNRWLSMTVTV
jgi:hypothetical protein